MSVTIRDVARAAGVSITTVSRALNDAAGVSPVTQNHILRTASLLGYSPNRSAQSLRRTTSNMIGVVIKGPANPFFTELLEPIERCLREHGYVVSTIRVLHNDDEIGAYLDFAASYRVSGFIMLGGWRGAGAQGWERVDVPSVLCTVPEIVGADRASYSSVAVDDAQAIDLIVAHLLGLGHERIAFLGPAAGEDSIGTSRMEDFVRAMQARGIDPDPRLLLRGKSGTSSYSYEYGRQVTHDFLSSGASASAIVGMSDVIAVGALRALHDAGLKIPQDMAVTGFDGVGITQFLSPRLTTVAQPIQAIAEETCHVLFERMRGPIHRHVLLPATLIEAESTVGGLS